MRTSSVRWVRVNRQGQGHGVTFTTWSGELGVWWSGSGRWCGVVRTDVAGRRAESPR